MEALVTQLFSDLQKEYAEKTSITDRLMKVLWCVFQRPLLDALDIVDREGVTKVASSSTRTLFKVIGSSGLQHTCFSVGTFCTCSAFAYFVLRKGDYLMCKHVLAARLAEAMNLCKQAVWSDEQIAEALQDILSQ